ncbi:hypothetical protein I6A60_01600 [Frankia sp. AgB1.9]|uniref:hypothetical protein n=1 Tax=unclassified Frankia TaxID=2632575 RepID=UPI001932557B|nr:MULTISPECIES: hypothetical protein [unclassified Frankia]MBL7490559.1 hypothetical protein [Frankia sp. AgW1.1]MBL7546581.1 hypothetical protein [Frankia sp. AgB1.9]MBL7622964.1 hypothetical protein [Frankia sp. AgB1.8]
MSPAPTPGRGATGGMILDAAPDGGSWTGPGPVDLVLRAIEPPGADGHPGLGSDRPRGRRADYRVLARSGGHLVVLTPPQVVGRTDYASQTDAAGSDTGWRPVQRAIARTAVPHPAEGGAGVPSQRVRAYPVRQDVIVARAYRRRPGEPGRAPAHRLPVGAHHPCALGPSSLLAFLWLEPCDV